MAQKNNKGNKKSKQEEKNAKFLAIEKLVESRDFVFDAERAFPSGGQLIELGANPGQLVIQKDMSYAVPQKTNFFLL